LRTVEINTVTVAAEQVVADSHFYFRGRFVLPAAGRVTVKVLATNWFEGWLDGEWLAEGPARFDLAHPEYETIELELGPGEHVLAMHVHYEGVFTRIHEEEVPLFVFASVEVSGESVAVEWRYLPLEAYRKTGHRIDFVLGWIEWCQTEKLPRGWKVAGFDDSRWVEAPPLALSVVDFKAAELGCIRHIRQKPRMIGEGTLANRIKFEDNHPTFGFMVRQLHNHEEPAQGRWMRFDLDKVRLGRPEITLNVPAGTVVQIGYSEFLYRGRVVPDIAACVGGDPKTCNLDHFVARGGGQTLKPLHPKGGRFLEVHIFGDLNAIKEVEVVFEERVYYGDRIEGSFSCSDDLLGKIWVVGVETLRSCSEDAITDNPTRALEARLAAGGPVRRVGRHDPCDFPGNLRVPYFFCDPVDPCGSTLF